MKAVQPLVEFSTIQDNAVLSLLGIRNASELPVHLQTLMSFKETDREGRYDNTLEIWVFPTVENNQAISLTPCYPTYGNPEAEEG